jgi:hypothetical protein
LIGGQTIQAFLDFVLLDAGEDLSHQVGAFRLDVVVGNSLRRLAKRLRE